MLIFLVVLHSWKSLVHFFFFDKKQEVFSSFQNYACSFPFICWKLLKFYLWSTSHSILHKRSLVVISYKSHSSEQSTIKETYSSIVLTSYDICIRRMKLFFFS